jgi:lysozyme
MASNEVIDIIKKREGFRSKPYRDTRKILTVGYGTNIEDPSTRKLIPTPVLLGLRDLTPQEAEVALMKKLPTAIMDAQNFIGKDVYSNLPPSRQNVLVDMAYQLGGPRLSGFKKVKESIASGDFNRAADEILNSDYAKQTTNRAYENAYTMLNGLPYDPTVVQAFQKQQGLKPDGVVGPITYSKLKKRLGK